MCLLLCFNMSSMRASDYKDGAGGVHESLMVINQLAAVVHWGAVLIEAFVDGITCTVQPAKLPWQVATGLLLLIAAIISGVRPWSKGPEWLAGYQIQLCTSKLPVSELHVKLRPLRTILQTSQTQGTINEYLRENGKRCSSPRSSMLKLARMRDRL